LKCMYVHILCVLPLSNRRKPQSTQI
jgi:hypothetical protein